MTTPSGDTIVCWHPPPRFPYHLTQPLPRHEMQENSKLKTQYTEDMKVTGTVGDCGIVEFSFYT